MHKIKCIYCKKNFVKANSDKCFACNRQFNDVVDAIVKKYGEAVKQLEKA